jgi:hypothetical protein
MQTGFKAFFMPLRGSQTHPRQGRSPGPTSNFADILDRMGAKAGIGILFIGLFVSLRVTPPTVAFGKATERLRAEPIA